MSDQNAPSLTSWTASNVTKSEHDWLERRFSNMTEKEKILFQGAMELEKPQEIGHVMRIASQLDCYDLFYGAGDEAALGKFVMESIECSSDAARPFLNAEHLGAAYHQSQNGAFCNGNRRLCSIKPGSGPEPGLFFNKNGHSCCPHCDKVVAIGFLPRAASSASRCLKGRGKMAVPQ